MTAAKLLAVAERILVKHPLCDACLGRQFALLGYGLSNRMRGLAIKTLLLMSASEAYQNKRGRGITRIRRLAENGMFLPAQQLLSKEGITDYTPAQECHICQGFMGNLEEAAERVITALKDWEAATILIGSKVAADMTEREEQLCSEFQIRTGEPLKAELNREIGKLVTSRMNLPVDFSSPDIVAIVHVPSLRVELQVNPLYIYGRYRKLIRGIPQTRWPCRECGGRGCPRCEGRGRMYAESVEELIAPPILRMTEGREVKFHGAGREDIDARMLGGGRPFVIEILMPKKRDIDLEKAEEEINTYAHGKVEVSALRFANKEVVKKLKTHAAFAEKVYKAIVHVETPVRQEDLQVLERLPMPLEVRQQTPLRVLHRRADRVRRKLVFEIQITPRNEQEFELVVRCQGGLYVKEFISGDEGRTTPSIAEILGKTVVCHQLDVIDVAIREEELPW